MSLYSNTRFRENSYSGIYYAVINIIISTENRHNPTQNGNSISKGIWKKIIPAREGTKYCVRMLKVTLKIWRIFLSLYTYHQYMDMQTFEYLKHQD